MADGQRTAGDGMRAIVVYQSLWGNTAAVARAIAEGIGPEARALSTAEATGPAVEGVDLIVAGSPVMAFGLPSERALASVRASAGGSASGPDLSQPSMSSWLKGLPAGRGGCAGFDTRLWWSPGGAVGRIVRGLERAGYRQVARGEKFIVKGKEGPLRDGEIERARVWGVHLRQALG